MFPGSGKSTLAFDLVFNEAAEDIWTSLKRICAFDGFAPASRPDVDAIYGIPPTAAAIEQRTSAAAKNHRRYF